MDALLAIVSKRDWRSYGGQVIDEAATNRIIDAGRMAGSGLNRQRWRFDVVATQAERDRLAEATWTAQNLRTAPLVIAISIWGGQMGAFDAGRAAQNMMLAAWNEGIVSCPNGFSDAALAASLLGTSNEESPLLAISFAYPARPSNPETRSVEDWKRRANRKARSRVVQGDDVVDA